MVESGRDRRISQCLGYFVRRLVWPGAAPAAVPPHADFLPFRAGRAHRFFRPALVWLSINGTFLSALKQIFIALLAVIVGNLLGKLLGLQKISNRLGRYAGNIITPPDHQALRAQSGDGFSACTMLFCAAPLGLLGAVADGLSGYFYLLAVKAVMDGLATLGFVKIFGWPAALSAFPVFLFLGGITLVCQLYAVPFLDRTAWTEMIWSIPSMPSPAWWPAPWRW